MLSEVYLKVQIHDIDKFIKRERDKISIKIRFESDLNKIICIFIL